MHSARNTLDVAGANGGEVFRQQRFESARTGGEEFFQLIS
jgi:hypothetical protein